MSFFTTMHFYRPTPPPVVTGPDLAKFVKAFEALKVSEGECLFGTQIRFGKAIDQDDKPTILQEQVIAGIGSVSEIEWDLETGRVSIQETAKTLAALNKK